MPEATCEELASVPVVETSPSMVGIPLLQRLALNDAEAAALLGKSRSWFRRLQSQGGTPAPVRVGGSTVWRTADLVMWSEAGFPPREQFELLQRSRPARSRQRA